VRSRGVRAGLSALFLVVGLAATSGCGVLGHPLTAKPTGAASASASASPSPSAAAPVELAAGQCFDDYYNKYQEQGDRTLMQLVDCSQKHFGETVYVGRFVGASAAGTVPLLDINGSAAALAVQNNAYQDCSTHADQYFGHSWIHPSLTLQIVLPADKAWENGERWYRCDVYQRTADEFDAYVERTGSLKTKWFDPFCVNQNKDGGAVACKSKHPGEFVGGFMLPAGLKKEPATKKETQPYSDKCWKLIAAYIGVAPSRAKYIVGVSFDYEYGFQYWASGRRAVWCFTWTGPKASSYVTGSAKGGKGKGL
jgi:hypothetical protein